MRQRLGQHFLENEEVIETIISSLALHAGETVIEIGPGEGALTVPLAKACKEKNCKLIAIEKDEALATLLASSLQVEIIKADALKVLPKLQCNKLVGNIPYYITGSLFRLIGELKQKPALTILMIQKEVAERVSAQPPQMNLLAAATQIWADIEIIAHVDKKDFTPPPEVDSAVIELRTNNLGLRTKELGAYYACIKAVFKQPRKKLSNNIPKGVLEKAGISPDLRGQNLSISELIKLSKLT